MFNICCPYLGERGQAKHFLDPRPNLVRNMRKQICSFLEKQKQATLPHAKKSHFFVENNENIPLGTGKHLAPDSTCKYFVLPSLSWTTACKLCAKKFLFDFARCHWRVLYCILQILLSQWSDAWRSFTTSRCAGHILREENPRASWQLSASELKFGSELSNIFSLFFMHRNFAKRSYFPKKPKRTICHILKSFALLIAA